MSMQEVIKTFADKMYEYRKETGLTQEELSDLLELDNSYVSLLERGARVPSLITLDRIAKVFGVKPHDLLADPPGGEKLTFRQKELIYIIEDGGSKKLDKIYRILKILKEPTEGSKGAKNK